MARDKDEGFLGSHFGFKVDGKEIATFTAVSGLSIEIAVTDFTEKTFDGPIVTQKIPGRTKYSEITLKRGYTTNKDLYDWFDSVAQAGEELKRTTAAITIYDRTGKPVATFNLDNCWPSKLSASDLSTGSDDAVIEDLTIQHEKLDWA